jgi:hypothetical protein
LLWQIKPTCDFKVYVAIRKKKLLETGKEKEDEIREEEKKRDRTAERQTAR